MTWWTTPLEEPNTLYNSINATELDNSNIVLDHGTILKEKLKCLTKNEGIYSKMDEVQSPFKTCVNIGPKM